MSDSLDGVRAKIARAKDQVSGLDAEVHEFLETGPYVIRVEYEAASGEDLYRVRVLRQPPLRISAIVGEIVHDLRSALDHLAWQLTEPTRRGRDTGFPIFSSAWGPGETSEAQFLARVEGMSPDAVAVIQRLQPRQPGPPVDEQNLLGRLHRMNLEDKHRLLNVLGGAAEQRRMTIGGGGEPGLVSVPWPWSWGMPHLDVFGGVLGGQAIAPDYDRRDRIKVYIPAPDRIIGLVGPPTAPRPFDDGAVLTQVIRTPEAHVKVDAEFTFSIVLDEGEPLISTLQRMISATEEAVGLLARFARGDD